MFGGFSMTVGTLNNQCGFFARFFFRAANQLINFQNLHGNFFPSRVPLKMLQYSADHGHVTAMSQLGSLLCEKGVGRVDKRSGFEYVRIAAKNGDVCAQYKLGCAFYDGNMVHRNLQQAMHWLALAAERGHLESGHLLHLCQQETDDSGR